MGILNVFDATRFAHMFWNNDVTINCAGAISNLSELTPASAVGKCEYPYIGIIKVAQSDSLTTSC
jgi:hypothetical protein